LKEYAYYAEKEQHGNAVDVKEEESKEEYILNALLHIKNK